MSSDCEKPQKVVINFDTDPQYYLKSLTYAGVIGLFINSFGIYMILLKSPTHFKSYKWHLFNYQLCSTVCDLILSLCTAPVFFLPIPVGMPTGIFNRFRLDSGIQMVICSTFIHLIFAATLHMFFYKWQMIVPTGSLLKFSKRLKSIILIFVYLIFLIPHFIFLPSTFANQPEKKAYLLNEFPIYGEIWQSNSSNLKDIIIFYMPGDLSLAKYILGEGILGSILGLSMSWFWIHTVYILRQKGKFSTPTKQMQYKKYLVSLSSQMTIPMAMIIYPGSLIGLIVIFRVWNVQEIIHISVFLFCCHGIVGTFSILSMNEHYRNYLLDKFFHNPSADDRPQTISLNAVLNSNKTSTRPSTAQPAIVMA